VKGSGCDPITGTIPKFVSKDSETCYHQRSTMRATYQCERVFEITSKRNQVRCGGGARDSVVVDVLCYTPEGRGFNFR
jgi:hypothetical protein